MTVPSPAETQLLRARHELVNTLVRYLRAVDDQDLDGVLVELGHATVDFGGSVATAPVELTEAYRSAFAAGGRTRHLLHEVEVTDNGAEVVGRAAYQRWSLDTDPPQLTALGSYHAEFGAELARWHLTRLVVHRDRQRT